MEETSVKRKTWWPVIGLFLIILAGLVCMCLVTSVDYEWTMRLREIRGEWRTFKNFMSDTLFEGEMPGGVDPIIIFIIVCGAMYLWSWMPKAKKWVKLQRPNLGFILMSSLCVGTLQVQTLKWAIGRARPKLIIKGKMLFTPWYEFGDHFIANGGFRGSFPSGHTATAFLFMTLAYVLLSSDKGVKIRLLGCFTFLFTLFYTVLMGISRSMGGAHWLSDSIFSLFAGWTLVHVIYFWGLRIPRQMEFCRKNGVPPNVPILYEVRIALFVFLSCLGIMCLVIGPRAVYLNNCPWLVILTPIGACILAFCAWQAWKIGFFNSKLDKVYLEVATAENNLQSIDSSTENP